MKLCKDCEHFRSAFPAMYSKCAAFPSPVTGKPDAFCDIERDYGGRGCGREGKLWTPRTSPRWKFWKWWRG